MLEIIIAVFIVVILMVGLMFVVLKRMVRTINESSKSYFVDKLQNYDELIAAKENTLNNLITHIKNLSIEEANTLLDDKELDDNFYYDFDIPSYQDENFFENYRKINEKFNLGNIEIVNKFLSTVFKEEDTRYYQFLISFRKKLNHDFIYNALTISEEEQIKFFKDVLSEDEMKLINQYILENGKYDLLNFISYLDDLIRKSDPTIYIKVASKNENFNYLNKYISTEYSTDLYVGILIIYKNKLYDYSLN
jgi:hypothetical protein